MTAIQSLEDLKRYRVKVLEKKARDARLGHTQVIVSMGSCGIAAGAQKTMQAIQEQADAGRLPGVQVSLTGCNGQCEKEPIVQVITPDQHKVTYGKVSSQVVQRILDEHVLGGKIVQEYVIEN
jgi:NADP-reducing hydrogenase subunit HndB